MKKNKMMRLASLLLVLVLMTSSVVGGTFAKYTTSVSSEDKARVAYWGFQSTNTMDLQGLFLNTYNNVASINGDNVIAPGTEGSTTFSFAWDEDTTAWDGAKVNVTGPEVAYNFTVAVEWTCDDAILNNPNIVWQLDDNGYGKWTDMVADIVALSGNDSGTQYYAPNTLPAEFTAEDDVHTISWKWVFDETTDTGFANNDVMDTAMGNAQLLDDCWLKITITATQEN